MLVISMGRNVTIQGIRVLGDYLSKQIEGADLKQVDLLDRLDAIGFKTDNNAVSRLLNGQMKFLRADLISSLAALKIFVNNQQRPLTTDELIMIACEEISPPGMGEVDPSATAYPEAVRFLLKAKGGSTVEEFAERLSLKPSQVEKILHGKRPTIAELLAMGVLFEDRNPMLLATIYGVAQNAPLPNGAVSEDFMPQQLDDADG